MKRIFLILTAVILVTTLFSCTASNFKGRPDQNQARDTYPSTHAEAPVTNETSLNTPAETTAAKNAVSDVPGETSPVSAPTSAITAPAPTETAKADIITRDRAIEIALSHAALSPDSVFSVEAELDRDRKVLTWEVEFENREYEYSYDINAYTGEIIRSEQDRDR